MAKIVSTGRTLSSPEYYKKKQEEKKRRRILWLVLLLIFLAGVVLVLRMERFLISDVKAIGADVVTEDEIQASVLRSLAGNYLWLIPRANALIYPRGEVRENLMQDFGRFKSVETSLDGTKVLEVSVIEREPFALYCADVSSLSAASSCYFLDEGGFVFDRAPEFSGPVYFVYSLEEPLSEPLGSRYMEEEEFGRVSAFISSLEELGLSPLALVADVEEMRVVLPGEASLLWKRESAPEEIYSNLNSFLNTEEIKSDADFLERVRVLDLRIENQVRYRFHEE